MNVRYIVDDVEAAIPFYESLGFEVELVADLRAAGARFRSDIVEGRGGRQVLLEDPSGNPIELFQPPNQE